MLAVPKIPRLKDGSPINFRLVNHIIKRVEYAASIIEEGAGEYYIGFTGATGASTQIALVGPTLINNQYINFGNGKLYNYPSIQSVLNSSVVFINLGDFYKARGLWITKRFKPPISISTRIFFQGNSFGADGVCIHISKKIPNTLGGVGGGLGVLNIGIPIVSVELDTFQNTFDPPYPHFGITTNGNVQNHLAYQPAAYFYSWGEAFLGFGFPIEIKFFGNFIEVSSYTYLDPTKPNDLSTRKDFTISANVSI